MRGSRFSPSRTNGFPPSDLSYSNKRRRPMDPRREKWTDNYECGTVSIFLNGVNLAQENAMNSNAEKGMKVLAAPSGVDDTLDRLETLAKKRGLTVFARINFFKDAAASGLKMQPAQLLILGNPAAGTPLMVASPGAGLDLPLKVLAWQDEANRSWVSFNTPEYLQQRHGFPAALIANIAGLEKLVQAAVTAAD